MTETLISIVFGAAITWHVASLYYRKSAEELNRESAELKRLNTILLKSMEQQGWIKINYHEDGSIGGFEKVIEVNGIESFEPGKHGVGHG